ncbi:MAG: formate dehydrogenase accessory sulfurtransferase FdhD, partial [Dehalococcoidales bacterium]|nr:formate dehydrogenase accessory sulfurtransferase FdhD [Dehalococcoidales bacterium]
LADGRFSSFETPVVIERELKIILNGSHLATASLMPGMEREFVTGYLFSQGFIKATKDISSLTIEGTLASVTLPDTAAAMAGETSYRIVSGGGRTAFADSALPQIQSGLKLEKDTVFKAMNRLFEIATVYKETEGVHAAGIFTPEAKPVCVVEDIGRHNCLDKAIGYALLNGVDCGNSFIVSTGRMASEMVAKLCRAGFPVAATKTAVTDRGRETALTCGMTLIGFVRDTGTRIHTDMDVRVIEEPVMKIYTGAERVTCN